jgi:hypothetical protein
MINKIIEHFIQGNNLQVVCILKNVPVISDPWWFTSVCLDEPLCGNQPVILLEVVL